MTRWTTCVALILATLTFAAPAGAQIADSDYADVLAARAQAGAASSAEVVRAIARQEHESALTARGKALNEMLAPSPPAGPTTRRFDWGAAASGAGATLALVLGVLGTAMVVRRSRKAQPAGGDGRLADDPRYVKGALQPVVQPGLGLAFHRAAQSSEAGRSMKERFAERVANQEAEGGRA